MNTKSEFFRRPLLIVDRDGTIVEEPPIDKQLDSLEKFSFIPGAISGLKEIAGRDIYDLVLATNQDGLGTDSFPEATFWPPQNLMINTLKGEGVTFSDILIDRTFQNEGKDTRKPGVGMFKDYIDNPSIDLTRSWVIGDRETDVQLAKNLGARSIMLDPEGKESKADFVAKDWSAISAIVFNNIWASSKLRVTKETSINLYIDLRGTGRSRISTGVPFFDHMLTLFAAHARVDLWLEASGDLPHHLIEDVAIVLGKAFKESLGACVGINRYGFFRLPMDESLADVALDFSGRSELVWEADFAYELVEGMPTQMIRHFYKSLSSNASMTLNVKASGDNDHHKCEAIFKAFARSVKVAIGLDGTDEIPSTKGEI